MNNAGGVAGQVGRPLEEVTEEDWQVIFDVNLNGAFNFSQAVVPGMKSAGWGRIVNISSGAGLRVSLTGIQAYASAKAGLIGLTRQLAHELGPFGITVNCVAPGFVRCNPTTERQWEAYGKEGQETLVGSIATRRLGRPEDIAHAVLFFASDYASWITGQTLSCGRGAVEGGDADPGWLRDPRRPRLQISKGGFGRSPPSVRLIRRSATRASRTNSQAAARRPGMPERGAGPPIPPIPVRPGTTRKPRHSFGRRVLRNLEGPPLLEVRHDLLHVGTPGPS